MARDPLGKKPLYYAETAEGLVFGSTLRALLQQRDAQPQINFKALRLYLQLGYVPAPETAFEGIYKLAGGQYLIANAQGIRHLGEYWKPNFEPKWKLSEADLQVQILEKLEQATRLRMISDVPLGAFLSGGIDSSAVVAMMSRHSTCPVKTFSVGFAGNAGDEAAHARRVAQHFGCEHTELEVQIQPSQLPDIVRHYEEPFADAAAIPTYFMSQVARQHVTVVLNGDGGDEDFAGYTLKHRAYIRAEALAVPDVIRQGILGVGNLLPNWQSEGSAPYRLRKSLHILGEQDWRRNLALMQVFAPADLGLASTQLSAHAVPPTLDILQQTWDHAQQFRGLDRELYFSLALHLPEQLLVKVDRASMAWALEARSPLLDRQVVEFCARIPAAYKLRGGVSKYIFKKTLAGILPTEILTRPKQGFIPPLGEWLQHELRELVISTLLAPDSFVAEFVSPELVQRIVREHLGGYKDHQRRLYTLLNLELWERLFIRNQVLV